eukprot:CAMPEP_0115430114 /NCGR_PEP_ID=MMETSP0271-20121206/30878_1 /TAXON_ID=71861 /ORGANISM="Scrippsiella trochoidea, Strain CCMP3099" /LENGTH=126 /DNA_ID=CAMNT_0002855333 /DNA_START=113 /DNA_END=490 /DNA_ORIENTATION=+
MAPQTSAGTHKASNPLRAAAARDRMISAKTSTVAGRSSILKKVDVVVPQVTILKLRNKPLAMNTEGGQVRYLPRLPGPQPRVAKRRVLLSNTMKPTTKLSRALLRVAGLASRPTTGSSGGTSGGAT